MAKIFGASDGSILAYAQDWATQQRYFQNNPAGTSTVLEFDEDTNPALAADILLNTYSYSLVSGPVLKKNGAVITVTASSQLYTIRAQLDAGFSDATFKSMVFALWNGTATNAQAQKALAYVGYKLKQAGII